MAIRADAEYCYQSLKGTESAAQERSDGSNEIRYTELPLQPVTAAILVNILGCKTIDVKVRGYISRRAPYRIQLPRGVHCRRDVLC